MPSKKRKYNARFPAGRIKKIMQTDEEVGKVAQAVPIIISRTLELFVESLLGKALQVTTARNAKTLSPSHVKHCILAEARFDFLRDLVKNIPDVSAAEEKDPLSDESSPNSSRFSDMAVPAPPPRRLAREDSNSSSSCDVIRVPPPPTPCTSAREALKRLLSADKETPIKTVILEPDAIKIEPLEPAIIRFEPNAIRTQPSTSSIKIEPGISTIKVEAGLTPTKEPTVPISAFQPIQLSTSNDTAIDLSKKSEVRSVRTANFYQETLPTEEVQHRSVITVNPRYSSPQPSTSYTRFNSADHMRKIEITKPPFERHNSLPRTPVTPITPLINIDFSKNLQNPEIKVLDSKAANIVVSKNETKHKHVSRQNSKSKIEVKKLEKPPPQTIPVDIDRLNSGNLQIDEDYDT